MYNENIWLPWIDLMLQHLAETEQVAKQLELVRELEVARLYGRKCKNNGDVQSEEEAVSDHPKYKEYVGLFGGWLNESFFTLILVILLYM